MVLMELSVLEQNKETWKKYNLDNMTMAEISIAMLKGGELLTYFLNEQQQIKS